MHTLTDRELHRQKTLETQIYSHTVPHLVAISHFDYTFAAPLTRITVTSTIVHSTSHTVQHNYITKQSFHEEHLSYAFGTT